MLSKETSNYVNIGEIGLGLKDTKMVKMID